MLCQFLASASQYNNTHRFYNQMQVQKMQENTPIHGKNFQGMLHHHPDYLKITIIQSQHQRVHTCKINAAFMMQNPLIFTIFGSIDELSKELARDNNIEITDEKKLVINIDANYKDKAFHHCITLQTEQLRLQSVIKQTQFLFDHLSEVNRYYLRQRKINLQKEKQREMAKRVQVEVQTPLPQAVKEEKKPKKYVSTFQLIILLLFFYLIFHKIYFREIKQTQKIRIKYSPIPNQKFNIQNNGVIMNNYKDWNAILHSQSLPSKGIFYYEFKILETKSKYIMSGVCGKHISDEVGSALHYSKFFLSLYVLNGNLYANGQAVKGKSLGLEIQNNIMGVQINLNDNYITWAINKKPIFLAEIPKHLFNTKMNPCISMYTPNDKIQLVN